MPSVEPSRRIDANKDRNENLNRRWTQIYADGAWEQIAAGVDRHVVAGHILKNVNYPQIAQITQISPLGLGT